MSNSLPSLTPRSSALYVDAVDRRSPGHAAGVVKVWHEELGWGGLSSEEVPGDVWAHFSNIDASGYPSLTAGDRVEFRWLPNSHQDEECGSWPNSATWVRRLPSADGN